MSTIHPIADSSLGDRPRRKPATPSASKIQSSSVQALPTPPQTKTSRKRKRGRLPNPEVERLPAVQELVEEADQKEKLKDGGQASKAAEEFVGYKKRKISKLDALAEQLAQQAEEDAFWGVGPTAKSAPTSPKSSSEKSQTRGRSLSRSPTRSPSSSPIRLLRRTRSGLLSPPPSKRQQTPPALPVTPPRRVRGSSRITRAEVKKKLFPQRDSPNNPFLLSDGDSPKTNDTSSSTTPVTPLRHVEKSTITYVFRGVKGVFENPLYDPSQPDGVQPTSPGSPSRRPVSDPEFSPTPYCPPKLLFPEARRHDHARRRSRRLAEADGSPQAKPQKPAKEKGRKDPPIRRLEWDSSDEEDEPAAEKAANVNAMERMGGVALEERESKAVPKPDERKAHRLDKHPEASSSKTSRKD